MPVLLVAILDDPEHIWDVLDAWQALGVPDATIFDSTGLHRAQTVRDDVPLFPSVYDLLESTEAHHRTIWSVVGDEVDLDTLARETERIVGPLDAPHTGILFALPILRAWGLRLGAQR
jgi:hypothetical protein